MLLVTGSMGHVGYATVKLAAERGVPVLAQYHNTYRDADAEAINGDVTWARCDLTNSAAVSEMCNAHRMDGVIHTAAIPNDNMGEPQPLQTFSINAAATVHLLEIVRTKGWRRFLYASTGSVHQTWRDMQKPIPETARAEPLSLYGTTKRCAEMMVETYVRTYGLSAASIRLSWVYGPPLVPATFDGPRGPIPHFLKSVIAGEQVSEASGAEFAASFTFVEDCAAGLLAAYDANIMAHTVYHLGSGVNYTTGEVAEVIRRVVPGSYVEVGPGTEPWTSFTVLRGPLKCDRMLEDFGFTPGYSLESGIEAFAEWMRMRA